MSSNPPNRLSRLWATVDMGSNGIRFAITDAPQDHPSSRLLSQLYSSRAAISLYDSQFNTASSERQPVDKSTIQSIVKALQKFKVTCTDYGVPSSQTAILATEATRTAPNSNAVLGAIRAGTGWEVTVLPKEREARCGALGIVSSLPQVRGLVMDLGGGSTQVSWVKTSAVESPTGPSTVNVEISKELVSLPYGSAALLRLLETASKEGRHAIDALEKEVEDNLANALARIDIPPDLIQHTPDQHNPGKPCRPSIDLYLSGGGFRGWGYLLMSQISSTARHPYPIPQINGFRVTGSQFFATSAVRAHAESQASVTITPTKKSKQASGNKKLFTTKDTSDEEGGNKVETNIHRISPRRLMQLPATALLVAALQRALTRLRDPPVVVDNVTFCTGGTPAGYLYDHLRLSRFANPLWAATKSYARNSPERLYQILIPVLPAIPANSVLSPLLTVHAIAPAVVCLLHLHAANQKDVRALAALQTPITGVLAAINPITHIHRAALALALCERWGGRDELPSHEKGDKGLYAALVGIVGAPIAWWCKYLGRCAALVGGLYPAWFTEGSRGDRVAFAARLGTKETKEGVKGVLELKIKFGAEEDSPDCEGEIKAIEKVGKKKEKVAAERRFIEGQSVGGTDVWGLKVDVVVDRL